MYQDEKLICKDCGEEISREQIELPLAEVLFRMEVRGFRVDVDGLAAYGEMLGTMCEQYMENIYNAAGVVFNVNSPKQLGEVLFDTVHDVFVQYLSRELRFPFFSKSFIPVWRILRRR